MQTANHNDQPQTKAGNSLAPDIGRWPDELWQRLPSEFIPWLATRPRQLVPLDVPRARDASEEELHRHSLTARLAETRPPFVPQFPFGSWAIGEDDYLFQLREFDFEALRWQETRPDASDVELGYQGRLLAVEKYVGWINEGSVPPPLTVSQSNKGNFTVVNGHHRGAALWRTGARKLLAWTSDTVMVAFDRSLTWQFVVELAIASNRPVPEHIVSFARAHFDAEAFVMASAATGSFYPRLGSLNPLCLANVIVYLKDWSWAYADSYPLR